MPVDDIVVCYVNIVQVALPVALVFGAFKSTLKFRNLICINDPNGYHRITQKPLKVTE